MDKNQNKRVLAQVKAQRGIDRKEFFANGGEAKRWRPVRQVFKDKKKARSKRACRGRKYGQGY